MYQVIVFTRQGKNLDISEYKPRLSCAKILARKIAKEVKEADHIEILLWKRLNPNSPELDENSGNCILELNHESTGWVWTDWAEGVL